MKLRTEWKYICNSNDMELIENKISKVLYLDDHTKNNKYIIHSLYFDDLANTCMFDNDAGLGRRFKWRIRYYNDDLSYITLEKKEKFNGLGRKKTAKITKNIFDKILNGNISEVFWENNDKFLKQFCIEMQTKMFKPRVIIDYERTAYVEPISNIRITFDRNIEGSTDVEKFMIGGYVGCPLQDKDKHILEIKFDDILPSYIKDAAHINRLNQTTFSKYYLSRSLLERN